MEIEIHGLRTHNVEICENVENMAYVLMKIKRKMCYLTQIQVNNYEIIVKFFHICHNLT